MYLQNKIYWEGQRIQAIKGFFFQDKFVEKMKTLEHSIVRIAIFTVCDLQSNRLYMLIDFILILLKVYDSQEEHILSLHII